MSEFINGLISKASLPWQFVIYAILLVVGVFCLVKFCDIFVDSASAIAKKAKVSPLIIGLTIVAIGTSCPELAVSVSDSIACIKSGGNANVALGNVVGSNIANLLLVLGFSAVFTPMIVKKSICKREYPFLLGITALLVIFGCFFGFNSTNAINRWEAIILVCLIPVYIWFLIHNARKHPEDSETEGEDEIKDMPTWKAIILVIVGAIGVALGGEFVVLGSKGIAMDIASCIPGANLDLIESLVGLTLVAVGTSLPELVTSIIAAKKGQNELALGNVIGSNIFNTIFVLGIAGTVCPLTTGSQIIVDLLVMLAVTIIVFVMALTGKLRKRDGWILLAIYVGYTVYLILRTVLA